MTDLKLEDIHRVAKAIREDLQEPLPELEQALRELVEILEEQKKHV